MKTIDIAYAKKNLFQLVGEVTANLNSITIINKKGKNAVLISEDKWKNIEETLYLSSIPELIDDIRNIRANEDWDSAEVFNPDEYN